MFYNSNNQEYNDCVSKGACSVSPAVSSMQEVMMILLRQTAFYLIKLKEFSIYEHKILKSLIYQIAFIDAAKDFSELQILNIFSKHYQNLINLRKKYLNTCKERDEEAHDIKNLLKLPSDASLSLILKKGDKEFLNKYKKLSSDNKYLSEILAAVMKSVCVNIVSLSEYNYECEYASDNILEALNIYNNSKIDFKAVKKYIEILSKIDIELLKLIKKIQISTFGNIEITLVSASTEPNKAILVSGSNLIDLKNVLEYTKSSDIDVYTNGNLLVAHAFSLFKNYKNLKGHFGNGMSTAILDFATFPGAILLTKNEAQNIEYLYRGRLFTTDKIAPKGVVKICNSNFSPLLESARQAKGFAKGQTRQPIETGYDPVKLNQFIDKAVSRNYDYFFIIGHSTFSLQKNDYFKKFFDSISDNSFAVSFSYNPHMENVFVINLCNNYPQIYGVLQKIFEKIPIDSKKLAFFLTKCDVNSLSNIINLKCEGAKNIFLSDCPPTVINPSVLSAFNKLYNINTITEPEEDLKFLQ